MDHSSLVTPLPPRGRQVRRLTPKFRVTCVHVEDGLRARLLAACGVPSAARWFVGNIVHRHQCGIYGPVSKEDRLLNDYLLAAPAERAAVHRVVSVHSTGRLWVSVSTILGTGETTVRRSVRPSRDGRVGWEAWDD